jgi:hypothetical protein
MKTDQSLAGYIREHLSSIEARLKVGIRQEVILQELQDVGYQNTTIQTFRNLLYRARKKALTEPIEKEKAPKIEPASKVEKVKPKEVNTLKEKKGFAYAGTANIDPDELF